MSKIFYILVCIALLVVVNKTAISQARLTVKLKGLEEIPEYGTALLQENGQTTELRSNGSFVFEEVNMGTYTLVVLALELEAYQQTITVGAEPVTVDITPKRSTRTDLNPIEILAETERSFGIERISSIRNFTLYEGKKNEIILLDQLTINTATNNTRQLFQGITGINIWESDGAGLQLGIGGRGLNPNRTSNFNTRQNGYDISADALGYPESYYTPPAEALERIEVIRGAASLQYGTQFGGMVNFILKQPVREKQFSWTSRITGGSWNFLNSFNSVSGTSKNNKWAYYAYFQRKQGDGWRPNSAFELNSGFAHVQWKPTPKHNLQLEYTHMDYLAQQAGGLTDAQFRKDPLQSFRARNWFKVNWKLIALHHTYTITKKTELNTRLFYLDARRQSLGNLERINVIDFNQNRTLIDGQFKNVAGEIRLAHKYAFREKAQVWLAGIRVYRGQTRALQGDADASAEPHFSYLNPTNVEGSDYTFPNYNVSAFFEHIFRLSNRLTITPGLRLEYISTKADGYYRQRVFDFAGNVVSDQRISEELDRERQFAIAGIGFQYTSKPSLKWYANISQNYRAINFTDLRIQNPNFRIDPNISDERGYTADLGVRGKASQLFNYEVTLFYLYYSNRIGQVLRSSEAPLFIDYRYRTNISASRNIGIEAYGSMDVAKMFKNKKTKFKTIVFANVSVIDARYIKSQEPGIDNNFVEMVPPIILRSGITVGMEKWSVSYQFNYTHEHYSDASNAVLTATAVEGIIPTYTVSDLSASWQISKHWRIETSCNNLLNEKYFTRRAESYPGPGIIPSDARSFFLTLQWSL